MFIKALQMTQKLITVAFAFKYYSLCDLSLIMLKIDYFLGNKTFAVIFYLP
mgnify:CR=1 FL=1